MRVTVALADLMHDCRGPGPGLEGLHLGDGVVFIKPSQRCHAGALCSLAVGAVAVGTGGSQAFNVQGFLVLGLRAGRYTDEGYPCADHG